jgi:hypothetical protein
MQQVSRDGWKAEYLAELDQALSCLMGDPRLRWLPSLNLKELVPRRRARPSFPEPSWFAVTAHAVRTRIDWIQPGSRRTTPRG